jgi:serine/threonine-protein kinase
MLRLARKRAGDERRACLDGVIVTAGAPQPQLKPGIAIAVLRAGPSARPARHREGIVHGDVEPSNTMLTRTGNAEPIDIGAAFARRRPLARRPTSRPRS